MKYLVYAILILLGILFLVVLLPLLLLLFLLMLIAQLFTGRSVIRVSNFRYGRPAAPAKPEQEVPASEAIIDAEVVDLPDEPAQLENGSNSQKTQ